MTTDDTDAVRKDLQILYETIARNRERDWSDYRDSHEFRLVADGVVRVAKSDPDSDDDGVYRVRVDGDGAVGCDCFVASRRFDDQPCRHMRAVDAHPRL